MPGTRPTAYRTSVRRQQAKFDRKHRKIAVPNKDDFAQTVERMTNKQRQQWMRAGQPGKRDRDVEPLWAFVAPPRIA